MRIPPVRLSRTALAATAFALTAFAHGTTAAQDVPSVQVTWTPEQPVHGTLFRLRVTNVPPDADAVTATVAGEPLHFRDAGGDTIEAIAAVPLDHGPALEVPLAIARASGAVDTVRVSVPVTQGRYALERLTVAPRFGAPPDSATAARIAREQRRALAVARAAHETPRLWRDVVLPRTSRITSGFGSGREFNGQVQSRHTGTDFAGAVGAPVRAAARGVVALVDTFHLAGRVIYIDHGEGLVSGYFHLSRQLVQTGDTVDAGQTIGHVGASGRVTGPHLHWVVRYGGVTVDPLSLVALANGAPPPTPPAAGAAARPDRPRGLSATCPSGSARSCLSPGVLAPANIPVPSRVLFCTSGNATTSTIRSWIS